MMGWASWYGRLVCSYVTCWWLVSPGGRRSQTTPNHSFAPGIWWWWWWSWIDKRWLEPMATTATSSFGVNTSHLIAGTCFMCFTCQFKLTYNILVNRQELFRCCPLCCRKIINFSLELRIERSNWSPCVRTLFWIRTVLTSEINIILSHSVLNVY